MTTQHSWRDHVSVHPVADSFPLLTPEQLKELAADIKKRGLEQKVVLYRDMKTKTTYLLDDRLGSPLVR